MPRTPTGMNSVFPTPGRTSRRAAIGLAMVATTLVVIHLLALHQGPTWTSPLLIGDHLFDLALALSMLWYCLALGRKLAPALLGLSTEPLSEDLAALGLGIGAVSLALLGAGLLHLFYPAIMLGAGVALTFWLRDELATLCRQALGGITAWRARGMPTAPTHGQRLILLVLLLELLVISPRTALPPSYNASVVDLDTVSYHLAAPKMYVAVHGIVPRPDMPLANTPSGGDLLNVLGLFAGSDTVGRTLNILFTMLIGLATYALGRRHFGGSGAWLGALLFFATDWLAPFVPTNVPDFSAAFLLVLGFSDLLGWASRHGQTTLPRNANVQYRKLDRGDRILARAGLLIGLAVSFKLTNLPALPAAVLIAGIAPLLQLRPPILARLHTALRAATVLGICTVIPLAPWLLKNWYFFRAPFYPEHVGVNDSGAIPSQALVGTGAATLTPVAHLWWILTTLGSTSWHYLSPLCPLLILAPFLLRHMAGRMALVLVVASGVLSIIFVPLFLPPRYWLGPIAVSDALLAAVFYELCGRLRTRPLRATLAILLTVDATLWLATVPIALSSIFWLAMVVAGELAIMLIVVILQSGRRRMMVAELSVVALLCLGTLLRVYVAVRETSSYQYLAVAGGTLSRQTYLTRNNWYYPAYEWVNHHTPRNTTVVLVALMAGYYLDRPYLDDWYYARLSRLEGSPATRAAELATWCRAGVRYAVFNTDNQSLQSFPWTRAPGLQARLRFAANGVYVLSVEPCAAVPASRGNAG